MNIYIHNEISSRELDSKILLGYLAASRGHQVVISRLKEITGGIKFKILAPGVFLTKSLTPDKVKIDRHQKLIDNKTVVTSIDEESGIDQKGYDEFAINRYSDVSIDQSSAVFGWGDDDTNTLKKFYPKNSNKIYKTGSPRVDLWKSFFFDYWVDTKKMLKKPFLLISSNLNCTNFRPFHQNIKILSDAGYFKRNSKLSKNYFYKWSEDYKKLFEFIEAIKYLSKNNIGYDVVLRPHPTEDINAWKIFLKDIPNVHVIREDSITSWVKNAFAVMHNGCTTAIEATISGKPVITYTPFQMEYAHELSNTLGYQIKTKEELLLKTNELFKISNTSDIKKSDLKIPEEISNKLYIDKNELAVEKIIKIWESLDDSNLSKSNNWIIFYFFCKIVNLVEFLRKIIGRLFPSKFIPYKENQKFPPLNEKDVCAKVERFQNILGVKKKIKCKLLSSKTILLKSY